MNNKKCLECGEPIKGRADKKFCDDQCRTAYNNKQFKDAYNFMRRINRILKKNRKILAELNPDGKTTVSKSLLLGKGFDFNYFTSIYTTRNNQTYCFCYDQGYLHLGEGKVLLVEKKKERDN